MKRLVKRVSLLVDVLNDFFQVEGILLKVELNNEVQSLAAKQMQQYNETLGKLRELLRDLTNDVAQRTSGRLNSRELACSLVVLRRGG
jgi:hypothetical protein